MRLPTIYLLLSPLPSSPTASDGYQAVTVAKCGGEGGGGIAKRLKGNIRKYVAGGRVTENTECRCMRHHSVVSL
jgi:hypothetical protein